MSPPPQKRARAAADEPAAAADGVRGRLSGLFARAANRTGEGAERLREAAREIRRPALLQQALAAQERGNLEAAFWLLKEEYAEHCEHPDVAVAFWNVAGTLERAHEAAPAAVWLLEHHAASGETELAAQYFAELKRSVPDALVTPTAIVRMLPALRERLASADDEARPGAEGLLRRALHHALDERNPAPSPGLAFRLFKEAREVEPEAARRAAEIALASPDLHETKQQLLRRWLAGETDTDPPVEQGASVPAENTSVSEEKPASVSEENHANAPAENDTSAATQTGPEAQTDIDRLLAFDLEGQPPQLEPAVSATSEQEAGEGLLDADELLASSEPPLHPLSDDQVAAAADRLPPPGPPTPSEDMRALVDRVLLPAVPTQFGEEALELLLPGGRESRVGWREIQALAVAEITGLGPEPVTVIDCVLNWRRRDEESLRVVRMRLDSFEPKCLVEDAGEDPLETFLAELLERTHAVPLPDPESALGLRRASFESLEAYEHVVLGGA